MKLHKFSPHYEITSFKMKPRKFINYIRILLFPIGQNGFLEYFNMNIKGQSLEYKWGMAKIFLLKKALGIRVTCIRYHDEYHAF
jgi:hypothetical protein